MIIFNGGSLLFAAPKSSCHKHWMPVKNLIVEEEKEWHKQLKTLGDLFSQLNPCFWESSAL